VTPFVAVFEDLHWADESTLLLLQHVVQGLAFMPALVIGTYRDVQLDVTLPFARTLESLRREKLDTRLQLRRLSLADVGAMLELLSGHAPPPSLTRIVFDETEGNPFFVEEVFRHLDDEGRLFDEHGSWRTGLRADQLRVPEGVRLVIERRLERLAEAARRVLTRAAVIGRSFSLQLLEDLESAQADAVLDAVEAAERAHLVEEDSAGHETRYRFVHELIRQTLAETLSLPRRQRLHARVANAIERVYAANVEAHAPVLAHHLYQASTAADTDNVVNWLTRAARQAASSAAFEDALTHLDNILSLMEGDQTTRVAELQVQRATVLRSLGRMPDAIAGLEQALAMFEANGDANRFAETCIPLAMIFAWTVRSDEARNVCQRGLGLLGSTESPTRIILMYILALSAVLADDITAALSMFNELEQVQVPPHPAVIRTVSQLQTYLLWFSAQLKAAEGAANETILLCESSADVWGQVEITFIRALTALSAGRIVEGTSIARKAVPLAEKIGHWGAAFYCKWCVYGERLALGDFDAAGEFACLLDEYERLHYVPWGFIMKVGLANVARLRGRIDEAVEWCRLANIPKQNHFGGYANAALALTFAQAGDGRVSQALADALPFVPRAGQPAPEGRWRTLVLVIEALALAGRFDDAATLYPVSEDLIEVGYAISELMLSRIPAGIAAACAHNWSRAEEHYRTAIHQADIWSYRVCQPIARFWYAEMLRMRDEQGDHSHARTLLNEALAMCESLGMPLYARQVKEKLLLLSAAARNDVSEVS
jgi:tetratricopeptide (TPR) repeat protein